MRNGMAALALAAALLLIQPLFNFAWAGDGGGIPRSGGRAGPPQNSDRWDIVGNVTLTGHYIFDGNITIYTESSLTIKEGGSLIIPSNRSRPRAIFMKAGGSIELRDGSRLEAPRIEAESGTGLTVVNRSVLKVSGTINASTATILESTVLVVAPDGLLPGEPGCPAILRFPGGGTTLRSTLGVSAGNGAPGLNATGMAGGSGGDATVVISTLGLEDINLTIAAGNGADGGSAGGTSFNGGSGGSGGTVRIQLSSPSLRRSSLIARAGNAGRGVAGYTTTSASTSAGDGGAGGNGGSVQLDWSGRSLSIASSRLELVAGNGAKGGDGGLGNYNLKNGGNGSAGGDGGSVSVAITTRGGFNIIDSDFRLTAGYGSTGGIFGRALLGGSDGRAGAGGAGGSCRCGISLEDTFTGTNASIACEAGNGGAGGVGIAGGKGGAGGASNLTIDVAYLMAEPTFTFKGPLLSYRGGHGGAGGRGLSIGQIKGQPGDGGKGGGARLAVHASSVAELHNTSLLCEEGAGGAADKPGVPGNPGVGELYFYSHKITMWDCTATQPMGPVDGMDKWALWSTEIASNVHFLPPREAGMAEEYWRATVAVNDIFGNAIRDGSVTVELMKNDSRTILQSKRTDPLGAAEFWVLGARYTPSPAESVRVAEYIVRAIDDRGGFSKQVSFQAVRDVRVTLTIIAKPNAPLVTITQPDARLRPILQASDFIRFDGTIEPLNIEGEAWDHPQNPDPAISAVELRIGEDGPWLQAHLEPSSQQMNLWKWNYTWDVYNWALNMLSRYPLGIIPAPIYARAYNEKYWSDNLERGGSVVVQNLTVRLVRIPPAPPVVEIVKPVHSNATSINFTEVRYEKAITFDARAVAQETRIMKWVWCFDDSAGFKAHFSSPDSPEVTIRYSKELEDAHFFVVLKVYDNESARRSSLVQQGVSVDEFPYQFDPTDGSVYVKLRVHVLPSPPPPPRVPVEKYALYIALGVLVIVMAAGAVRAFQIRQKHIEEKRRKEERESLRIEVTELKCARCGEALADPEAGCMRCKAQDKLTAVQTSLSHLKTLGVNVSEAEVMLEAAVDAFDARSFDDAIAGAEKAGEKAKELEAKYMDTSSEIAEWEGKVSALKVDLPEADVSELETKIYHSRLALGRGDHAEALKNLEGMDELLTRAAKVGQKKTYETLIESCKRMVDNVRNRGVVVAQRVEAALAEAASALEKLEYEKVKELCKEAELLVKEASRLFVKASENLRRAEARVLNAKGMGKPVGECDELVTQAKGALSAGNYARVMELSNKILTFFGVSPRPAPSPGEKVAWKKEVVRIEGSAGPAEPKKPVIVTPGPAAPPPPPPPAPALEPSREELEKSQKAILAAQNIINNARERGVDTTDPTELLEKARAAHKARIYDEAVELAKSARFLAEELMKVAPPAKPPAPTPAPPPAAAPEAAKTCALPGTAPAPDTEPNRTIQEAERLMAELAKTGADLSGPEYSLTRAKCARDGGSGVVALTYAKEAIQAIKEIKSQYDSARKELDATEALVKAARDKGVDVSDAEFQLRQARAAMEGGAFGRVTDTCKNIASILAERAPELAAPAPPPALTTKPREAGPGCPRCNKPIKPHWKTCPFCGASIAPAPAPGPPAPAQPAPAPPPAAPSVTCAKCGATMKPHWKVCPACGAAAGVPGAPPAVARCPVCGQRVEPSMSSCPACKTSLTPESIPPEPPKRVLKVVKSPRIVTPEGPPPPPAPPAPSQPPEPTGPTEKPPPPKIILQTPQPATAERPPAPPSPPTTPPPSPKPPSPPQALTPAPPEPRAPAPEAAGAEGRVVLKVKKKPRIVDEKKAG
ncbi:MAG: zinc ribbon domain-containing protein [Thermoplasmata archaeon]